MKNILLLVHDDSGQEARFQAALDLGRALEGHITCLDVAYTPPLVGTGFYEEAYVAADLMTQEVAREAANRVKLEKRLAHEDVPWDWINTTGDIAPCVKRACDLADVVVINRQLDDFSVPEMRAAAGEVITRSGKPVLAVPGSCERLDLSSALIAWDGSPCAAAALRAAVPLLRQAERVTILEVTDGSVAAPAEDAAAYLSRHDVHAEIRRIPVPQGGARRVILQEASGGRFGYLVMGGFGHLRFVEALFGGVTREMLTNSPIPVFLAH